MPSRTYKFRGSRTHGRGAKAGRGKGIRGGTGGAGLHKHKYIAVVKYAPDHFGRKGFKRHVKVDEKTIFNLSDIDEKYDWLVKKGCVTERDDFIEINLSAAGVHKLLGGGSISRKGKFKIKVSDASESARTKIKKIGGELLTG
jgi:large subunit ribosomal protein L15